MSGQYPGPARIRRFPDNIQRCPDNIQVRLVFGGFHTISGGVWPVSGGFQTISKGVRTKFGDVWPKFGGFLTISRGVQIISRSGSYLDVSRQYPGQASIRRFLDSIQRCPDNIQVRLVFGGFWTIFRGVRTISRSCSYSEVT